MINMGVSKVVYNEVTLVDLTNDTVTADTLAEGTTAHGADGEEVVGTMPTTTVLYTEQTLTSEQMVQARANIGATTLSEVIAALPKWEGGSY